MESAKARIQKLKYEALQTEEELARLRLLIKVYGLCHPDIQVARLSEEQAHEKLRETMLRENDPKMPAFQPSRNEPIPRPTV